MSLVCILENINYLFVYYWKKRKKNRFFSEFLKVTYSYNYTTTKKKRILQKFKYLQNI